MKIILDNGKEYEFAVGTSEHNVMQAMLNIINNESTPTINPNITSQTLMMFDGFGHIISIESYAKGYPTAYYVKITNKESYEFFKSKLDRDTDLPVFNPCGMYLMYDNEYDVYHYFTETEYKDAKRRYDIYHNVSERMGLLSDFEPDGESTLS